MRKVRGNVIVSIIVLILIVGIVWGYFSWIQTRVQHNLDKGCKPVAWNSQGVPTIWKCPHRVKID